MICRTWHGCVPREHAEGFARQLQLTGVQHAEGLPGCCGAQVRRETQGKYEHFFLATWWQDLEAVRAFAGERYHVAVTYPDDEQFALLSDPYVFHHQVAGIAPLES